MKIGTIFEASHVPMRIWLQAMYLIAGSKKGISSNQLHRTLSVTLKTDWFMSHRIREAMRDGNMDLMGGGRVEVDETIDRDTGKARSIQLKRADAVMRNHQATVDLHEHTRSC